MITSYKPQFIEKIFTDQLGQQFRLVFLVTNVDGEMKGRLVSAELISKKVGLLSGRVSKVSSNNAHYAEQNSGADNFNIAYEVPICLPIICEKVEADTTYISSCKKILSPFSELFFFMSQPTRAPSII